MSSNPDAIDPRGIYSASEAARLLPSSHAGKCVRVSTLHRWRAAGQITMIRRGRHWFVVGSELLRLLGADQVEAPAVRGPAQETREVEAALEWLRAEGLDV